MSKSEVNKGGQWNDGKSPNPKDKGKGQVKGSKVTISETEEKALLKCFTKYVQGQIEHEQVVS